MMDLDAEDIIDLLELYEADERLAHLRTEGVRLVPGNGSSRPKVLVVGESPGAHETTTGRPFTGAAGKALRSLIQDVAGIGPKDWYGTYLVKYRLPANPGTKEVLIGRDYLREEWRHLGAPRVLVAVGGVAWAALSERGIGIREAAGEPWKLSGDRVLWPMLDPQYGLSRPDLRPVLEWHWEKLGEWYKEEGP